MNILKRMKNLKDFMLYASEQAKDLPPERQKMIHDGLYYTVTLDSKIRSWVEQGMKTFILSSDLIDAFMDTDISLEMFPSDFRYPFSSFVIEGDKPFFNTTTFNDRMELADRRSVDSIMYMDSSTLLNRKDVVLMDVDGNMGNQANWQHSITAMFPGAGGGLENIMMYMKSDKTIRHAVDTKKDGDMMLPISEEDARGIANIFFNTIMYINDPTRDVADTQSSGSRKFKVDGKKTIRNQYIRLRPPKACRAFYASSGRTLDKRFIVRGHWRNQAFGEKRLQRKKIWVHPFWKGEEMSAIISRKYRVN